MSDLLELVCGIGSVCVLVRVVSLFLHKMIGQNDSFVILGAQAQGKVKTGV